MSFKDALDKEYSIPHYIDQVKRAEAQKPTEKLSIHIRDADESDINFIFNSWLKSGRNCSMSKHVDNAVYYSEHHKLVEKLLKRCSVLVAVDVKDTSNVYGYIVYEKIDGLFTIHFTYVKHNFRMLGIMSELLKKTGHDFNTAGLYTHDTSAGIRLAAKYMLVFHPYLLINY